MLIDAQVESRTVECDATAEGANSGRLAATYISIVVTRGEEKDRPCPTVSPAGRGICSGSAEGVDHVGVSAARLRGPGLVVHDIAEHRCRPPREHSDSSFPADIVGLDPAMCESMLRQGE
jgi:hypothetical protein